MLLSMFVSTRLFSTNVGETVFQAPFAGSTGRWRFTKTTADAWHYYQTFFNLRSITGGGLPIQPTFTHEDIRCFDRFEAARKNPPSADPLRLFGAGTEEVEEEVEIGIFRGGFLRDGDGGSISQNYSPERNRPLLPSPGAAQRRPDPVGTELGTGAVPTGSGRYEEPVAS